MLISVCFFSAYLLHFSKHRNCLFFKRCAVKSKYTNHQPMAEQVKKEFISTQEVNHLSCPTEDIKMIIRMHGLSKSFTIKFSFTF